jgi:3-oxosteroid 1-dehydrogenase
MRCEERWDVVTDCVIVGSGGGSMCAALAAADAGHSALIIEKTELIGGSTAMSGGVLWLPDNPVSRRAGVQDCREDALRYFASVVGGDHPSTRDARVRAFLDAVDPMVTFLEDKGISFRHCEGYSDYYDDRPGGKPRGRSIEADLFDTRRLGPWEQRLRVPDSLPPLPMHVIEGAPLAAGFHNPRTLWTVAKVAARVAAAKLARRSPRGGGAGLQGWMLWAAKSADIPIWTSSAVTDLIVDNDEVVGVTALRDGRTVRVRARKGVLLNSGGFSHNPAMRQQYGRQPASTAWTNANPGDTGEVLEAAVALGAAVDLMDDAWWIPSSIMPDGTPVFHVWERSKPHAFLVDSSGQRYVNEAASYMEVGQAMYERHRSVPAIPSWWIIDSRNRRRYIWGMTPGGITPKKWLSSGYVVKGNTFHELARKCGIDAGGLAVTAVEYNKFAALGADPTFHKGERAYDRYYGDPSVKPNPCVAPVSKPPFYAFALYPGDVGTSGGLITDEHARVLSGEGQPISGLYATGNCTASVMGRTYPGAGASIGASFIFGWIAASHMCGSGREAFGDASAAADAPERAL